ncbi:uncharacterized protein LOC117156675 isoform X1 [Bombus vancouverensis nearcticus]|uniref:uncharacterized protein LOC117156675 isoform X1 n=1 Tax=Bombus vancouverensis nearcticus TaxID=2705178 RepID=UPI00402B6AAE
MDREKKNEAENLKEEASMTPVSPTLFTPPTLNLMEQILLAKIEKQNFHEDDRETDARLGGKKKNFLLRRTDSMDSQNSASTYNSLLSSDSASSGNLYCRCDDCLLGIVDDYQRSPLVVDRKKIPFKLIFVDEFDFQEVRGLVDALPEREATKLARKEKRNDETKVYGTWKRGKL